MSRSVRLTFAALALSCGLALFANHAKAVVYSSVFDPVDFAGVATFDVSPGCLSAGPGVVVNDGVTCTVTWLTALVTLFDGPNSASLDYSPLFLPSVSAVSSIRVLAGELAGVDSVPIGPAIVFGNPDADLNGPWWIEYQFGSLGEFGLGIVNLYTGRCVAGDFGNLCIRDEIPLAVANVENFVRLTVSEPAVPALLLTASIIAAWVRRRPAARSLG